MGRSVRRTENNGLYWGEWVFGQSKEWMTIKEYVMC